MKAPALVLCLLASCRLFAQVPQFSYDTIGDTVEIRGHIPDTCAKSPFVFITKYNNTNNEVGRVVVQPNGDFVCRTMVREAGEMVFRDGGNYNYFVVTNKTKSYQLDVSCTATGIKAEAKNSTDNDAYKDYYAGRQKLKTALDTFKTLKLEEKKVFKDFQKLVNDYQEEISKLARQYKGTFIADHIITADKLSSEQFSSLSALRESFLQRDAFADPLFYNTFLAPRLISNYLDVIRDKHDTAFAPFAKALMIASKNSDASNSLDYLLYDIFTHRKEEALLTGFVKWAEAHPDLMADLITKARLERLSKCVAGSPFLDISLTDTAGAIQRLSDRVNASKLTLLAFYSPTCSHCKEKLPLFIPVWDKFKNKGLSIYTVAFEPGRDEWAKFIKEHTAAGWTNVIEGADNYYNFKYVINSFPSFILIDDKGKILSRMSGPEELAEDITARLEGGKQ